MSYIVRKHPSKRKIRNLRRYSNLSNIIFSRHASFWAIIIGCSVIFLSIVLFAWKEYYSLNSSINSEKISQFGTFIGGIVGSIWALAGVLLFYVALTYQRKELQYQRKEFKLQRLELQETRKIFEEQAKLMRFQQNESTFFNLLAHHNQMISNLSFEEDNNGQKSDFFVGNFALRSIWFELINNFRSYKNSISQNKISYSIYMQTHPKTKLLNMPETHQIFLSLVHMNNYIVKQLNSERFYFDTLIFNTAKEEKDIIYRILHFDLYNEIEISNREEFDKIMFGGGVNLTHLIEHKNLTPRFKFKFNFDEWSFQNLMDDQQIMCQIDFLDSGVLEKISVSSTNDRVHKEVVDIPLKYSTEDGKYLNVNIEQDIFNEILEFGPKVYGVHSKEFNLHFTFKREDSFLEIISQHQISKEGDKFKIRRLHL